LKILKYGIFVFGNNMDDVSLTSFYGILYFV
jgi:hypothetical protein